MGDNAKAENIIINQSKETNDIDKIKELILELLGKINSDTEIDNGVKEKIQKAINTTDKQIESGDKDMLEVCVDNLENVGNGVEKGTEVFKKIMVLVGLIRTTFGF
jgi:methyltransferase-like protein